MAIRSNVLRVEAATMAHSAAVVPSTGEQTPTSFLALGLWMAGGVVASAAISGGRIPSVADIVLRLIVAAVVFGAMTLAVSWTMRESFNEALSRWSSVLPFAVGGAVIAAWTGYWNDGSGAVALPLGQAMQFVVTLGLTPTMLGPDVFLRFVTLLSTGFMVYRLGRQESRARQIRVAVMAWVVGAVTLLIPSWAVTVLGFSRGVVIATAQDGLRVVGSALSNSHWSNFQQERFLTGIGDQLGVMVGFWTTAVTLIVGVCFMIAMAMVRYREHMRRIAGDVFRSLRSSEAGWVFGGAALIGYLVATAHAIRTVQAVPVILAAIALAALAGRLLFVQNSILIVGASATMLLGWPVLAAYLICAALCIASERAQGTKRITLIGAAGGAFVVLGAAFGVRSSMFPSDLAAWAIPMGLLAGGIGLVGSIGPIKTWSRSRSELVVFCATLVLCALFMEFFTGLAIAAFAGLAAVAMQKKGDLWAKYSGFTLLLAGWVMIGLKLFVG